MSLMNSIRAIQGKVANVGGKIADFAENSPGVTGALYAGTAGALTHDPALALATGVAAGTASLLAKTARNSLSGRMGPNAKAAAEDVVSGFAGSQSASNTADAIGYTYGAAALVGATSAVAGAMQGGISHAIESGIAGGGWGFGLGMAAMGIGKIGDKMEKFARARLTPQEISKIKNMNPGDVIDYAQRDLNISTGNSIRTLAGTDPNFVSTEAKELAITTVGLGKTNPNDSFITKAKAMAYRAALPATLAFNGSMRDLREEVIEPVKESFHNMLANTPNRYFRSGLVEPKATTALNMGMGAMGIATAAALGHDISSYGNPAELSAIAGTVFLE